MDFPIIDKIYTAIENGQNIILHGPGGTGKSYLLREIAKHFTEQGKAVSCTATTGIAAINLTIPEASIAGSTLHSWAGVGLADTHPQKLVALVNHNDRARRRWNFTDILIIDEISMAGAEFIDKLDFVGREIRRCKLKPFGGLQIVFSGDFLQLPPVKDKFAFESIAWKEMDKESFILDEPKRYPNMNWFNMLLRFRKASPTTEDVQFLRTRLQAYQKYVSDLEKSQDIETVRPTVLHSKRVDVDYENDVELNKLPGLQKEFIAADKFVPFNNHARSDHYIKPLDDAIPRSVCLKVGAQVMLKANIDIENGLANGSRGVILEILGDGVKVKLLNDKTTTVTQHTWTQEDKDGKATRTQIPLILAWALTIHKCVSGRTLISTEFGLMYMNDIIESNGWKPLSLKISTRKGWENTSQVYKGDIEDSYIITTRMGYTLEGSERHPLLVRTPKGNEIWKKLPEIVCGDSLVLKHSFTADNISYLKTSTFFKNAPCNIIDEDFGYVLGLLVGDGSYRDVRDGTVDFTNNDEKIMLIYEKIIKKTLQVRVCSYKNRRYFCSKFIRKFLFSLGLHYKKGPVKKVPWVILRSPISVQKSFIKGLFDADGGVNNTCVHFTTSSPFLVKEVHFILLGIGIISRRTEMPNKCAGAWRIEITGEDARNYYKLIGFMMDKKNDDWERYNPQPKNTPKSNFGHFPDSKIIAQSIRESYSLKTKDGGSQLISRVINNKSRLHFRHIEFLSDILELEETQIGIDLISINENNFFYDTVQHIEHSSCQMYDFEVPGSHSFLTNGIISHNCQGASLDYAICNIGPSVFCPGQGYVALSRVRSPEGLLLSEFYPPSIKADSKALKYVSSLEIKEEDNSSPVIFIDYDDPRNVFRIANSKCEYCGVADTELYPCAVRTCDKEYCEECYNTYLSYYGCALEGYCQCSDHNFVYCEKDVGLCGCDNSL
jgi:intein/homing endonuclease